MEVSKDDFVAWKNDQVTQAVMKEVESLHSQLAESILDGTYTCIPEELQLQIGKCIGVKLITEITHEDLT